MNTTSTSSNISINNSSTTELMEIISITLAQFDDYIQDAADKGIDNTEFANAYHEMERHYFDIKAGKVPNRSSIMGLAKHTFRLACSEIY